MTGPGPETVDALAARVRATDAQGSRRLIAIAGAPGSGKSTLAVDLVAALGPGAALVPMDGFHLDNRLLDARGLRARKGAPETFDGAGFVHMVRRLASEPEIIVPVFDRVRDIAIAGAQVVGPETETAVIEGNYLLLDAKPWSDLRPLFDLSVFLEVSEEELEERLIRRWRNHGHDAEAARARALGNDLPNARTVARQSVAADLTL